MESPTKEMYSLRRSFSVIGLTGRMGAGCSKISDILALEKESFFHQEDCGEIRKPSALKLPEKENYEMNLFRRKYGICYTFLSVHHKEYTKIDYKKVLFLALIDFYKNEDKALENILEAICHLFKKSLRDDNIDEVGCSAEELSKIDSNNSLQKVINILKDISTDHISTISEKEMFRKLSVLFFDKNSSLNVWVEKVLNFLSERNYYVRTFLLHKMANSFRAFGKPTYSNREEFKDAGANHVYYIANYINRIIKAHKAANPDNCHIVIDSLKNSLEVMFFKERYSAFYLMAINNQNRYHERIAKRVIVEDEGKREAIIERLIHLDEREYATNDFAKGHFFSPDIENCVQKAEIHINNIEEVENKSVTKFYSRKEQLLKVLSLIQQPGIITPSNQERCMLAAYNSKFNSGCISRQVGAVLTDDAFAIKSVGWNDVPKQNISCLFRDAKELVEETYDLKEKTYSTFELPDSKFKYSLKKHGSNVNYMNNNFYQNFKKNNVVKQKAIDEGKNCAYCFKSMHNDFEGDKNQVHTRSLHAEENAMLQITKYGGQAIKGGKLFTTASPCELCAKKACQIGVEEIYYIDPYPGISMDHVLKQGNAQPKLIAFNGIIGKSFNKLYEPFMPYKDELSLYS